MLKYKPLYLKSLLDPKPGDEEEYIIRGVFSNEEIDRQGDKVIQAGWDISEYMYNPVVMFVHDHYQPAVAQMIELGLNEDGNLAGAIKFAAKEYDFAAVLYKLYKGRYMRAFSAGFDAIDGTYDEINDIFILTKCKLYEVSCVNVGAVAMALAEGKGIDVSPLKKFQERQSMHVKALYQKSPACRQEGETESECVSRKVGELKDEGYDEEQASAIAYSVCDKSCSDKKSACNKKKEDILDNTKDIKLKMDNLNKAIREIKTLTARQKSQKRGRLTSKGGKKILVKSLNKAIRSLIKDKNKIHDKKTKRNIG